MPVGPLYFRIFAHVKNIYFLSYLSAVHMVNLLITSGIRSLLSCFSRVQFLIWWIWPHKTTILQTCKNHFIYVWMFPIAPYLPAFLQIEIKSSPISPLCTLGDDPHSSYPWALDSDVSHPHQRDVHHTLGISVHPRVWFIPMFCN